MSDTDLAEAVRNHRDNMIKRFRVSDGRPWYKQAVSGIYLSFCASFISVLAFVVISIAVAGIYELGVLGFIVGVLKLLAALFALMVAGLLLDAIHEWATNEH